MRVNRIVAAATQAAGMTALRRRHVLRSQSINKRVTGHVFGAQKYPGRRGFNKIKAFYAVSSYHRAYIFFLFTESGLLYYIDNDLV